jgi:hypothetical protein
MSLGEGPTRNNMQIDEEDNNEQEEERNAIVRAQGNRWMLSVQLINLTSI